MLSFTKSKSDCMGCTACFSVCPTACITMQQDSEGFQYPVSSDACIECGLCERICPIANPAEKGITHDQKAYAALSNDYSIWHRSASGGAFSEICLAWGDDKTIVVGAAWNGLYVHHICIEGVGNIAPLCKSKYVASSLENVFSEIKNFLQKDRKVIFCGTPCQIAGLKAFLRKKYVNLLTIDLICHGVGSPSVFNTSVDVIGKQFGVKVNSYEFRAKRKVHETDYLQLIGTEEDGVRFLIKDQYIQLFLSQLCLRPSCGQNCKFRDIKREGDITLADFKGLWDVFPDLIGSKKNYSTIVSNSSMGDEVVDLLYESMELRPVSIDTILKYNPLFGRQTWFEPHRDKFFEDFKISAEGAIEKWTKPAQTFNIGIKGRIKALIPVLALRFIYKLRHK